MARKFKANLITINETETTISEEDMKKYVVQAAFYQGKSTGLEIDIYYAGTSVGGRYSGHVHRVKTIPASPETKGMDTDELLEWVRNNLPDTMPAPDVIVDNRR